MLYCLNFFWASYPSNTISKVKSSEIKESVYLFIFFLLNPSDQ